MRTFIAIIIFAGLFGGVTEAQIPASYYSTAEGLTDANLKAALYNIIKGHKKFPYTSSSPDVWDILKETDKDTINPDNVILFYTGWSVNAAQEYNNGNGWTREHVWAKSRGDFGTTMGPGTDVHHLRPEDNSVNSARNNRWFDNCTTPYIDGDGPTGCFTSTTSWVWQPRDKVKGDVARMIFYMATRYEGENGEPDLEMIDYLPLDDNTSEPIHAKFNTLLQWHLEDPVDNYERHRNEVIYSYQLNRNPFIDHPEYVALIWSSPTSTTDTEPESQFIIYPNPVTDLVTIEKPDDHIIRIYTISGILIKSGMDKTFDLSSFDPGYYIVTLSDPSGKVILSQKIVKQ